MKKIKNNKIQKHKKTDCKISILIIFFPADGACANIKVRYLFNFHFNITIKTIKRI